MNHSNGLDDKNMESMLAEIEGENTMDLWGSIPCAPWSQ